jgi:hypothetical protein
MPQPKYIPEYIATCPECGDIRPAAITGYAIPCYVCKYEHPLGLCAYVLARNTEKIDTYNRPYPYK